MHGCFVKVFRENERRLYEFTVIPCLTRAFFVQCIIKEQALVFPKTGPVANVHHTKSMV
jgi:hypothetical protein